MDNKVFLFPLTNSLLFKKVTLPFHVFEPRFRQMVRDALALQIPIAVVPYHPSGIYKDQICVAGLPHILSAYPDGRLDIYITGAIKCRLKNLEEDDPYKIYSYEELEEDLYVDDAFEMDLDSLKIMLERWAMHFLPEPSQREAFFNTLEDPELLVNYCAVFLVDDWNIKREVMEASSLNEKINLILQVIGPKEINLGPFMPTLKF